MAVLILGGVGDVPDNQVVVAAIDAPRAFVGADNEASTSVRAVPYRAGLLEEQGSGIRGLGGLDAVPLPSLPLPPPGRGQVAAAEEPRGDVGLEVVLPPIWPLPRAVAPTGTRAAFFDGYRDAGGQDEERVDAMIFCESSWQIDPGNELGLAQFEAGTWATVSAITGFADPYNAYHQGANVAVWASMINPGTSAGWPNCWSAW